MLKRRKGSDAPKKRYRALSAMQMAFQVSPVCVLLYILFSLVYALMQTVGTALATANFVDTATAILNGTRPRDDIYLPLVFLLLVLGVFTTNRSIIQLFGARIELKLQHGIKPAIVKKHAALDFKHIENAESWELISHVSRTL